MEKLLEMAATTCDQAEVYAVEYTNNTVSFENAQLHDIDSKILSGVSLRVIKDGKLGFAYIRNLHDPEALVQHALASLEGGIEVGYDFPLTTDLPQLDTYDPALEALSNTHLVQECARVCDTLASNTSGEIAMIAFAHLGAIRILNTSGTDLSLRHSLYGAYSQIIYPGSGSGIVRQVREKTFAPMPDKLVNEMIDLYTRSSKSVEPQGGKMKVIFMPNSAHTLTWRIASGMSAKNIYEHISPIADRLDERIFDERLTISDDPLNDSYPGARAFDDEGVPCRYFPLVEDGVLKNFYTDLNYAHKLNMPPTGHGYRTAMWGGDVIALHPAPSLMYLTIQPGDQAFSDLVHSLDRGIIVEGALGAHSGNIPNGDYSIGINPGFYVENGEIVGRVKDAMVAGNIYETLQHVLAVENVVHPCGAGRIPALLCDAVSVATKS
ncbi:TldD/PmbA family protein [candidate division KSB3 bacterium]|uniref:TldD/PmbA family protein n=1 Tax=candidate division KSB3 bacterium TaxID=2044937 RepID=A0A9D5JVP3_9BACT|nr:TldD/PmbA family protein [candidate division KSB3 bacterium]MBD3324786.1 TldD/PmbA family protein [candidate division KSB3 bacterium]